MNPLEQLLAEVITAEGPLRIDRYMSLCLGHPQHGYYVTRDPLGEPCADFARDLVTRRREFEDVAVLAHGARHDAAHPERQPAISEAHHPLAPHALAALELTDRDGIEEFIGEKDHRALGRVLQPVMPAGRLAHSFALLLPQHRAGFDEVETGGGGEGGSSLAHGAQHVGHQRAAPRSEFDEAEGWRLAHGGPCAHRPYADELAKNL